MPLAKLSDDEIVDDVEHEEPQVMGHLSRSWKAPEFNPPYSEDELRDLLIKNFSTTYKSKFGTSAPAVVKNVFSASQLVGGPVKLLNQRLANPDDKPQFKARMFSGSAVHKYAGDMLPDWFGYETPRAVREIQRIMAMPKVRDNPDLTKALEGLIADLDSQGIKTLSIREQIPYEWVTLKDASGNPEKTIIITGHPDFTRQNAVLELKTVESKLGCPKDGKCQECKAGTLCDGAKKRKSYVDWVIKKAMRQVGFYAKVLSKELHRYMYAYVVWIDDDLHTKLLSDDDCWYGYNYTCWTARTCADVLDNKKTMEDIKWKKKVE